MNHDQLRMSCYDIQEWQANFWHGPCEPCTIRSDDGDEPDPIGPGLEQELQQAREEYRACLLLCETAYCRSICENEYKTAVQLINEKYAQDG